MLKIKVQNNVSETLEDFINSEHQIYCLEKNENLTKDAQELKYAWILIIERLKTYEFLEVVEE